MIAHAKLPLILTAFNSTTLTDTPYARLLAEAAALEEREGILSASVFLVGSYIDAPDMGCSAVVVADGNVDLALQEARRLAQRFWDGRRLYEVETVSGGRGRPPRPGDRRAGPSCSSTPPTRPAAARRATGSGSSAGCSTRGSRSRASRRSSTRQPRPRAMRPGEGAEFELAVGHGRDPRWGTPLELSGTVSRLLDGRFRYAGGILGGVEVSMGPSAVIGAGSLSLLVMSQPTYDWADDQYLAAGLDPAQAKFVGVKNMMNFRFGYGDVMKGFFVLDLPGPTPPDMRSCPSPASRDRSSPSIASSSSRVIAVATSTRAEGGP